MCHKVSGKVSGGVIETMGLIGNEHGAGTVAVELLRDASKATGNDKSACFYWQQEK